MFRPTHTLRHSCRITLFTRPNCSLCDDAKLVLSKVWDKRPFDYAEHNVMTAGQEQWKALYEFDTPVIHIDKSLADAKPVGTTAAARKLMHRFKEAQVEQLMDEAERDER